MAAKLGGAVTAWKPLPEPLALVLSPSLDAIHLPPEVVAVGPTWLRLAVSVTSGHAVDGRVVLSVVAVESGERIIVRHRLYHANAYNSSSTIADLALGAQAASASLALVIDGPAAPHLDVVVDLLAYGFDVNL